MATHEELISVGSFTEKFKNPFRDYYNYGFKNLKGYIKGAGTLKPDFHRLQNIMADYFEWSPSKDMKEIIFMSGDSQSMSTNPVHRLYRFCSSSSSYNMGMFFHTLMALDSHFILDDEYYWNLKIDNVSSRIREFVHQLPGDENAKKELLEYINPSQEPRLMALLKSAKRCNLLSREIEKLEEIVLFDADVRKRVKTCIRELVINNAIKQELLKLADKPQQLKSLIKFAQETRLSEDDLKKLNEALHLGVSKSVKECIRRLEISEAIKEDLLKRADKPQQLKSLIKFAQETRLSEDDLKKLDEALHLDFSKSVKECIRGLEISEAIKKDLLKRANKPQQYKSLIALAKEYNLSDDEIKKINEAIQYKRLQIREYISTLTTSDDTKKELLEYLNPNPESRLTSLLKAARKYGLSEREVGALKSLIHLAAKELFDSLEKVSIIDNSVFKKEITKTVFLFEKNSAMKEQIIKAICDRENVYTNLQCCELSDEELYHLIDVIETFTYRSYKRFEDKMHPLEKKMTRLIEGFHLPKENEAILFHSLDNRTDLIKSARQCHLSTDQIRQIKDTIDKNRIQLVTSDLLTIQEYGKTSGSAKAPVSRTVNDRLNLLTQMGLLQNLRGGEKDNSRWELASLNAELLLEEGEDINPDFGKHFAEAVDFFSKYLYLGEIGSYVLDKLLNVHESPFRFKHEYFMHAANDYALIDLLHAIEEKKWCLISYVHGTTSFSTQLLCYPLQIRISYSNGREYLMFYNPFERSYSSMRIEFIEDIKYLDDDYVRGIPELKNIAFDSDIQNAISGLDYCWGVSTSVIQKNNAVNPSKPQIFDLQIECKKDEFYILNRLQRESRIGEIKYFPEQEYIQFMIKVNDYHEIMPWVRSLYSRIIDCQSSDKKAAQIIRDDIEKMAQNKANEVIFNSEKTAGTVWRLSSDIDTGESAIEHEGLFNELFSVYYFIASEVISVLYSNINISQWLEDDILYIIKTTLKKYKHIIGLKTATLLPEEILKMIIEQGFLTEGTIQLLDEDVENDEQKSTQTKVLNCIPKYYCLGDISFYNSVVPFSNIELRWIKTMLQDNKINMFLDEGEKQYIQSAIDKAGHYKAFPTQSICFYDRYKPNETFGVVKRQIIRVLLDGIRDKNKVSITYHTMGGNVKQGIYCPINITYSKRNDAFQGYFLDEENDLIYIFNLSNISRIAKTRQTYDFEKVSKVYKKYLDDNEKSVELMFGEGRNVVDRILSEFAPWKKYCRYNAELKQYTLQIFYHQGDEVELVVRLLGYGDSIQFKNKEQEIYNIYAARISKQQDRFRGVERDMYVSEYENGRL